MKPKNLEFYPFGESLRIETLEGFGGFLAISSFGWVLNAKIYHMLFIISDLYVISGSKDIVPTAIRNN